MVNQIVASKAAAGGAGNMKYLFKAVSSSNDDISQPAIVIPFVNTGPSNTIVFRLSGKVETFGFQFPIFDDGVDAAGGTAPTNSDFSNGTVITVQEQIIWLKNYLFDEDFDSSWTLTQDRYFPDGDEVVIQNLNLPNEDGAVSIVIGSFNLTLGTIGGF